MNYLMLALVFLAQWIHARHAVFDQALLNAKGSVEKVRQMPNAEAKPFLILFWAGWCGPCKTELELVENHRSDPNIGKMNIVAINVDELDDQPKAKAILQKIDWPYASLWDEGGQFFYSFRLTGELPYGMLIDAKGNLLESIVHLDVNKLNELKSRQFKSGENKAWKVTGELQYRTYQDGKKPKVAGSTIGLSYSSDKWKVGSSYKILGQDLQSKAIWEDELADSFIERNWTHHRARLGDDVINWMGGQLLAIRKIQATEEDKSLLGGHYRFFNERWDVKAVAGKIRNTLYGMEIDPLKDVSQAIPDSYAYGVNLGRRFGTEKDIEFKLAAANYKMEKNPSLGFTQEREDNRLGVSVNHSGENYGYHLLYSSFDMQTPLAAKDFKHPYIGQATLWWYVPITFLQYRSLPDYARAPTLIEQPGIAHDGEQISAVRFNPKFSLSDWTFELSAISESSLEKNKKDNQATYSLVIDHPVREFKSTLMYQQRDSKTKAGLEKFFVIGGYLNKFLSSQITLKAHKSNFSSGEGESYQAVLSADLTKAFDWKSVGRWALWLTGTKQVRPYYRQASLLDKENLASAAFSVDYLGLYSRLVVGQEPGGFVCANGICADRPALNGTKLDLGYSYRF